MAVWKDFVKSAQTPGQMLGQGAIFASPEYQNELYNPNSQGNLGARMMVNKAIRTFGREMLDLPVTLARTIGGIGGAIGGGLGGMSGGGIGRSEFANGWVSGSKMVDDSFGDWWRYLRNDLFGNKIPIKKILDADYKYAYKKMRDLHGEPNKKDLALINDVGDAVGRVGAFMYSAPAFKAPVVGPAVVAASPVESGVESLVDARKEVANKYRETVDMLHGLDPSSREYRDLYHTLLKDMDRDPQAFNSLPAPSYGIVKANNTGDFSSWSSASGQGPVGPRYDNNSPRIKVYLLELVKKIRELMASLGWRMQ